MSTEQWFCFSCLLTKASPKQWFCFPCPLSSLLSPCPLHWSPALLSHWKNIKGEVSQECGPALPLGVCGSWGPCRTCSCWNKHVLGGVPEHPAFIDFKPLQLRLHRSKVTQKWGTLEFLWVAWQHSGSSGSSPPCWKWAQPFQEEHSVALGSVELGQSVTLLLSGLAVCLECLCRQSAATQGSIDSNLLCLER